jgi:hypothetical protein
MIVCLLTLVLPCYIYHKKSLHGQKEVSQSSYHSRRISFVMWGRRYSCRPRTRGAASAAPKGAHGLEAGTAQGGLGG